MRRTRIAPRGREGTSSRFMERNYDAAHPMTPQQYYDSISRSHSHGPEARLLFAVLEDAIRCYTMAAGSPGAAQAREFQEVRQWVNTRGDRDVFSFDSICAVFEIEPEALRKQLNSSGLGDLPLRRIRSIGRKTPMHVPD